MELELLEDWVQLHRAKDPMHPADPNDICIGWSYAIVSCWKQKKTMLTEYEIAQGRTPKDEQLTLTYERTLGDARVTLGITADHVEGMFMRKRGTNWYYGSDEDQILELRILAVEDADFEDQI